MSGARQAVAADAGVLKSFVGCLACRCEADDSEARLNVGVVDNVFAVHDDNCTGVDGYGAGKIADVGGFSATAVGADAILAHGCEEVFGAGNELRERFARDRSCVAVHCAGNKDAIDRADAEQVVDVHDEAVLSGLAEATWVTCFSVVEIGECALGAGSVGVDDIALLWIASEEVGADLAEGSGKDAAVEFVHDCVDLGLRGRYTSLGVAIRRTALGTAHGLKRGNLKFEMRKRPDLKLSLLWVAQVRRYAP